MCEDCAKKLQGLATFYLILLPIDYTLKGHLYHKGTGVCLLRKKTAIKMKSAEGKGAPLGVLHFDTDISGLSLQVHNSDQSN